jgi:hypothetical protein
MFLEIFLLVLVLVAYVSAVIFHLWTIPVLSYRQGDTTVENGKVVSIEKIRPNVIEVGISHNLKIDPDLQQGDVTVLSASYTNFLHFRSKQSIPSMGDVIEATYQNYYHRFTGRSFNWVIDWKPYDGDMSVGYVSSIKI